MMEHTPEAREGIEVASPILYYILMELSKGTHAPQWYVHNIDEKYNTRSLELTVM